MGGRAARRFGFPPAACSLQPATTALEAHGVDAEEALEQLEKLLAELHKIEEV